jgi:hypothetical protein
VQEPPLVADLALLALEVLDQPLELLVRERAEIGKWFHVWTPFVG